MRLILYSTSIFFLVMGAIIAFQNSGTMTPVYIFLKTTNGNLFGPFAIMYVLGLLSGVFFVLANKKSTNNDSEDEYI